MLIVRIAFVGVSHWHLPLYLDPVLQIDGAVPVAVSDPDTLIAQRVAAGIGATAWDDWQKMCEAERPDLVFVLGRHSDMAEVADWLIGNDVPFMVEKPAGVSAAQVAALAEHARRKEAFAAIPFVFRNSPLIELVRAESGGDPALHMAFKFVAGSVQRYRDAGCEWMLHRPTSGGGCLTNLGVHFLDLAVLMLGSDVTVTAATMSTILDDLDVEDHAVVEVAGAQGRCLIETGYLYPAPHMAFDMHYSIRTASAHFAAQDATGISVIVDGRPPRFVEMPMSNPPYYPVFVRDVLDRLSQGHQPLAGLEDMAAVARLLESAYRLSPLPGA